MSAPDDDDDATSIYDAPKRVKKDTRRGHAGGKPSPVPPRDRSGDILVVSMKTPGEPDRAEARRELEAKAHQVKLRPLSELSGDRITPPRGHLAPPRDPRQARKRRARELAIWGSVVIVIACAVTLAVWLIAR